MSSTTPPISAVNSGSPVVGVVPNSPALSDARHASVNEFTAKLFGSPATIRLEIDPEFGTPYFVVDVTARADDETVFELDRQWHRRLPEAAGDEAQHYCLALHFPA